MNVSFATQEGSFDVPDRITGLQALQVRYHVFLFCSYYISTNNLPKAYGISKDYILMISHFTVTS